MPLILIKREFGLRHGDLAVVRPQPLRGLGRIIRVGDEAREQMAHNPRDTSKTWRLKLTAMREGRVERFKPGPRVAYDLGHLTYLAVWHRLVTPRGRLDPVSQEGIVSRLGPRALIPNEWADQTPASLVGRVAVVDMTRREWIGYPLPLEPGRSDGA